jgi:hypothetical protein
MKVWSKGFFALWAGFAVAGGLLVYFLSAPQGVFFSYSCVGSVCNGPTTEQIIKAFRPPLSSVLLDVTLLMVCLAGIWLVSSRLLRLAFIFQVVAIGVSLLIWLPSLPVLSGQEKIALFLIPTLLLLPLSFLTLGSLVVLSFGIARWKAPGNGAIAVFQALLAVSVGGLLVVLIIRQPRGSASTPLEALITGSTVATICGSLVLVLFLFRWGGWKQRPLIMGCLVAGLLAALLGGFVALLRNYGVLSLQAYEAFWFSPFTQIERLPLLFFLLGLLLLIQTERIGQKTRQVPALLPAMTLEEGAQDAESTP